MSDELNSLYSSSSSSPKTNSSDRSFGLFIAAISGGAALALTVVCAPFIAPALRKVCLPYVPATDQQISNVLLALKNRKGRLLDIGSGDGRIVLAAAKHGFEAHGVELNPWLVLYSRFSALLQGLSHSSSFYRKDLWKFDMKPYDNIVIFGVQEMMEDLHKKFGAELASGSLVVACRFPIPNREPICVIGSGIDTVWVYKYGIK